MKRRAKPRASAKQAKPRSDKKAAGKTPKPPRPKR